MVVQTPEVLYCVHGDDCFLVLVPAATLVVLVEPERPRVLEGMLHWGLKKNKILTFQNKIYILHDRKKFKFLLYDIFSMIFGWLLIRPDLEV